MMTFEQVIQEQLNKNQTFANSAKGKKLQKVLKLDPSDHRREKILRRLEAHTRVNLYNS
jgi:hypothetical protein